MAWPPLTLCNFCLQLLGCTAVVGFLILIVVLVSLAISQNASPPKVRRRGTPVHLLVMLGSGGHTAEMLAVLKNSFDYSVFTYRTYVVSSGDELSAKKAVDFEAALAKGNNDTGPTEEFTIISIPRARRVHQSYLTAPFSTLHCFWACLLVLLGRHPDQRPLPAKYPSRYPDIIVTNGPAVAVCMLLAAKCIRFFIYCFRWVTGQGSTPEVSRLRTVYVESWARVRALSVSGRILLPIADKFFVQWPLLAGHRAWPGMRKSEYCGWVVL